MQEPQQTQVQPLGWEDPLEWEMATCSSILAWKIPWTEHPGGLQSMELQSQTKLTEYAHTHRHMYLNCFVNSLETNTV